MAEVIGHLVMTGMLCPCKKRYSLDDTDVSVLHAEAGKDGGGESEQGASLRDTFGWSPGTLHCIASSASLALSCLSPISKLADLDT